jgi:RIO kinase 1
LRDNDLADYGRRSAGGATARRRRFDDDEPQFLKRGRRDEPAAPILEEDPGAPETGDRWSTWDIPQAGQRGPQPHPDWLVTELAAVDTELGILKTGKEADVFLLSRGVPDTDRLCLLAAKRYRSAEHRMFHRDAGYLEGRRVRESRVTRAMQSRSDFGRQAIAGLWAGAEFGALVELWRVAGQLGVAPMVPYPVQIIGTELLLEFIGDRETRQAAPRLSALRPDGEELTSLWRQMLDAMVVLARCGYAHGDLSPYNLLVHEGRLVVIDLPQVVDVIANPQGPTFLARDVHNVVSWFVARGLDLDESAITADLLREAGIR